MAKSPTVRAIASTVYRHNVGRSLPLTLRNPSFNKFKLIEVGFGSDSDVSAFRDQVCFAPDSVAKSFCGMEPNSPSRRRDDRIIMWETTPPCAKLTGDSGSGFEAALIGDCRLFRLSAEN